MDLEDEVELHVELEAKVGFDDKHELQVEFENKVELRVEYDVTEHTLSRMWAHSSSPRSQVEAEVEIEI